VYTLARSQPTAARAPSRELGTSPAPDIHEGTIVLSVRVGFTDAPIKTRRLFCDGPPYGSMHSGQGDVVGEFVRVLVGGGWWKCPGCVVPHDPLV